MKVLVLEDDYGNLKGAFDYMNLKYYAGALDIQNVPRTQDVPMQNIQQYDKIFVDINLRQGSDQDGFFFIKSVEQLVDKKKLAIITGSDHVQEKLTAYGLGQIDILSKPVTFLDLKKVMP
jgi:DNA-binding response OmpR family regulator